MFDSRVMETEFLNRLDDDPALVAAGCRFSDSIKTGVAPVWRAAAHVFILISVPGKRSPTVIRSGRITIAGRSNAGKSALFNPQ